jgi:hypothetical protein
MMPTMKTERFREFLKLPRSTGESDGGPEIVLRNGVLTVRYDIEGEGDTGPIWTTLRFDDAVALRVVPEFSVSAISLQAYSKVGIVEDSSWVATLRSEHGDAPPAAALHHFVVFFDHFSSVETIAVSCKVEE